MGAVQLSSALERVLIQGDLSALTPDQRISYYKSVCDSVGLNSLTKPFDYITLSGKLTLYAKRDATDQLRKLNEVSITIPARELLGDVYVVTARAKDKNGREDESTGAVNVANLKGEALANAYMKAETKAKRRVTLSICGLGLLDESEVDSIPGVRGEPIATQANVVPPAAEQKPSGPAPKEPEVLPPKEATKPLGNAAVDTGEFLVEFGQYKGKTLGTIELDKLKGLEQLLAGEANLGTKGQVTLAAVRRHIKTLEERRLVK